MLGDLSMTLCDPFAINFLSTSAMKLVNICVEKENLPRDQPVLMLLLRMLALGLGRFQQYEACGRMILVTEPKCLVFSVAIIL